MTQLLQYSTFPLHTPPPLVRMQGAARPDRTGLGLTLSPLQQLTHPTLPSYLGLGPPSGASIGRLSGVGALWDCVLRVCSGGGGCAGGGVPLGAVPVLS